MLRTRLQAGAGTQTPSGFSLQVVPLIFLALYSLSVLQLLWDPTRSSPCFHPDQVLRVPVLVQSPVNEVLSKVLSVPVVVAGMGDFLQGSYGNVKASLQPKVK